MEKETNVANKTQVFSAERDRDAWLAERRKGIGGSDVAVVLGLTPWKTPAQLWDEKKGYAVDEEENFHMRRGRVLEPIAADLYAEETGRKIRKVPMRRDKTHPHRSANIDRQILAGGEIKSTGALEIKVPGHFAFEKLKAEGVRDEHMLQHQWYLGVLGYSWGSFCAFHADSMSLLYFDIEADPELFAWMAEEVDKWWETYIVGNVRPPEEIEAAAPPVPIPNLIGDTLYRDDDEWYEAMTALEDAAELKQNASDWYDECKARVIDLVGDHAKAEGRGYRVSYPAVAGRRTLDKKALQMAHPEIRLEEFEKVGNPSRRFTFSKLENQ